MLDDLEVSIMPGDDSILNKGSLPQPVFKVGLVVGPGSSSSSSSNQVFMKRRQCTFFESIVCAAKQQK
jgi:hypothetical protein